MYEQRDWSPKSRRRYHDRVFTDTTVMQAVEQYETQYDNTNKPRDANDLSVLLMMVHNNKYPDNVVNGASRSKLARVNNIFYCAS